MGRIVDPTITLNLSLWIEASGNDVIKRVEDLESIIERTNDWFSRQPLGISDQGFRLCQRGGVGERSETPHITHDTLNVRRVFYVVPGSTDCRRGAKEPVEVDERVVSDLVKASFLWAGRFAYEVLLNNDSVYECILGEKYACKGAGGSRVLYVGRSDTPLLGYFLVVSMRSGSDKVYKRLDLDSLVKELESGFEDVFLPKVKVESLEAAPTNSLGLQALTSYYTLEAGRVTASLPVLIAFMKPGVKPRLSTIRELFISMSKLVYLWTLTSYNPAGRRVSLIVKPAERLTREELVELFGDPRALAVSILGDASFIPGIDEIAEHYTCTPRGARGVYVFHDYRSLFGFVEEVIESYMKLLRAIIGKNPEKVSARIQYDRDKFEKLLVEVENLTATLSFLSANISRLYSAAVKNSENYLTFEKRAGIPVASELSWVFGRIITNLEKELTLGEKLFRTYRDELRSMAQQVKQLEEHVVKVTQEYTDLVITLLTALVLYDVIRDIAEAVLGAPVVDSAVIAVFIAAASLLFIRYLEHRERTRIFKH